MSTIDGNISGNGVSPKGSIDNPYTQEEFYSMCNAGIWMGGYVEGIGYCLSNVDVTASWSGSDFDSHFWDSFPWDDPFEPLPDPWEPEPTPDPLNPSSPEENTPNSENGNKPSNEENGDQGGNTSGVGIGKTEWDDLLHELASITGTSISVYTANKYYQNPLTGTEIWVTAKGKVYDSSVLRPRPNGKYIQGVQGIRISKAIAHDSVVGLNKAALGLGLGFALYDAIQAVNEKSIERGITALREALSAFYLPYALADLYISAIYDAYVRIVNGTATYSDVMMLTTGYPTSAAYTTSYQYNEQIQHYLEQINNQQP